MKRMMKLSILTVLVMIIFTSCIGSNRVENQVKPYPATVRNTTIEQKPKAVASLSPSITKMLIELGYQDAIVGYSSDSKIEGITEDKMIGTGLKPDFEKIGTLAPEVIFTNVPLTKVQMDKLSAVKIKVVVMPTVKSVYDLKTHYVDIITAMSGQVQANETGIAKVDVLQEKLDYIKSLVPAEKPTFLYVASLDPIVATGDTFESSLLSYVGENLAASYTQYNVKAEQLQKLNPDVIFFASPLEAEHIKNSDLFKNSNAVKNNKLYVVDNAELTLQNDQASEVVRKIASQVYPDIDFTAKAETVSSTPAKKKWYEVFK